MRKFIPLLLIVFSTVSPVRADIAEAIVPTESPAAPNYTFDGAALYATHCASCHGDLAKTRIPDRRPSRIASAIRNVGIMGDLKHLSALEVIAIAKVLASEDQSPSGR